MFAKTNIQVLVFYIKRRATETNDLIYEGIATQSVPPVAIAACGKQTT